MNPPKPIEFIDLKAQQKRIRSQLEERIKRVLDHGRYIMGPEVRELEEKLSDYVGVKHCITCASGTDALLMPLLAYGVGPGDAVFTSPFTFISTAEVIAILGATPVFVDIDPLTFNLDPVKLREVVETIANHNDLEPRGIIPVDLFGQPADYEEIETIAREFDLFVLQDAAQSFGAEYKNRKACSQGDVAATSFFPAKPFGCYGDGGAIFCDDDNLAERLRSIRVHGEGSHKYENVRLGLNGRFDTIQAAILLTKLEILEDEVNMRNEVARRYSGGLQGLVEVPAVKPDRTSVWAQYSVLSDNREEIMAALKTRQVPTAIYYPKPLHLQDAFRSLGYRPGDFPASEKTAERIFSLPMHPYLEAEVQEYIIAGIKDAVDSK